MGVVTGDPGVRVTVPSSMLTALCLSFN
jgi:hypothetical protein